MRYTFLPQVTTPDAPLKDIEHIFNECTGLPVVRTDGTLVGVLSKKVRLGKSQDTILC